MVVMLTASLVSSCKVKVVEEDVEEKVEKEMGEKDGIEATTVKVSDVDIETKM